MTSQEPREHVSVRLATAGMGRVRQLAAQECEGNASQMLRKLLGEALRERARRESRPRS